LAEGMNEKRCRYGPRVLVSRQKESPTPETTRCPTLNLTDDI
jgi:hypothetical protein